MAPVMNFEVKVKQQIEVGGERFNREGLNPWPI
jgi:hypothetical protein